jgi:dTDP-4-dehydrorhamnose reductase
LIFSALITGLSGTLAPKVATAATRRGWQVTGWDRHRVPPADAAACRAYLVAVRPDAIVHLGMGEESWAGLLAAHASEVGVPFVFTSSAMVFDCLPDGPHAVNDVRTAKDDYGRYKVRCEDAVWAAPGSSAGRTVVRIGWQIDADEAGRATGNNMLAHLDAQQAREGRITASTLWRPACSFMVDTAEALLGFVTQPAGGTVHVDSNAVEGHTFDRVVAGLKVRYGRGDWVIVPEEGYRHDQRLGGGEEWVPGLGERLGGVG